MNEKDLRLALNFAVSAAREAGVELNQKHGNIETLTKGDKSSVTGVVTELDFKTEEFLAKSLGKFSKDIGFRGEEFGVKSHANTTWLVDPIDGTAHFIRGLPFCTTMIALIENGEVVLSVIYDFVRDDMYTAIRGHGAFRNEEKINVSSRSLGQSLLSFETKIEKPENYAKYIQARKRAVIFNTANCGFEFAMIASGKLDGRIGLDPYGKDWDFAPGSLLVSEAGGIAANIGKSTYDYQNHDYIIANPLVHKELTAGADSIFPTAI